MIIKYDKDIDVIYIKLNDGKIAESDEDKTVEEKKEVPFVFLSESSLVKEWQSEEDDIWDNWAKGKLKNER